MATQPPQSAASEQVVKPGSGWPFLLLNIALLVAAYLLHGGAQPSTGSTPVAEPVVWTVGVFMLFGYFTLQPKEARVLILFGNYKGTVRESGFYWANPLYARSRGRVSQNNPQGNRLPVAKSQGGTAAQILRTKISLRANNFNTEALKVNDKRGNPVEIAAVVVWCVENTAQAVFDVEDYGGYVAVQSESALRTIASRYAYDQGTEHEITLRGGADDVAVALKDELQVRLAKAGVIVEEARLTHLAYAPEIAPAMLRRQQAEAIVAARRIIVQNAVAMVQTALQELDERNVVKLDDERKAAMVSNLLVVLCGNSEASPVINTGTLYT